MADFARIKDQDVWINLDYVVRIERGVDEENAASVTFADGSTFSISDADSKRLLKRLRSQEEELPARVTLADGSTFTISNADGQKLLKQREPAKKNKKKKKKKADVSETADSDPTSMEADAMVAGG